MKIRYLKNAPLGQIDDIQDVPDDQAKVLIILGFAEVYDDQSKDDKKSKTNKTVKSETN